MDDQPNNQEIAAEKVKKKMDKEQARALQSAGGKKAHALGKARVFTSEEAKIAGCKGGKVRAEKRKEEADFIEGLIPRQQNSYIADKKNK